MSVNKFNIEWQMVRVRARAIKDVESKVAFVLDWIGENYNDNNVDRVNNWLKMTSYAYKDRSAFDVKLEKLGISEDSNNDLSKVSTSDLQMVFKDLSKRKYGFQYKSVPKAHTEFMIKLSEELESR